MIQGQASQLPRELCRELLRGLFALWPLRRILCWHGPRSCPKVAITFDDGPQPAVTPAVLAVLRDKGIRCTFFLLGRELAGNETIVEEIVSDGHEIGIHGFDHSRTGIPAQVRAAELELERLGISAGVHKSSPRERLGTASPSSVLRCLERLGGRGCAEPVLPAVQAERKRILLRPPHGTLGVRSLLWSIMRGYTTVLWSFDARDSMRYEGKWEGHPPDYGRIEAGDIVLMHDDNPVCVQDLPGLIDTVRQKGLEPVTVSELLGMGRCA